MQIYNTSPHIYVNLYIVMIINTLYLINEQITMGMVELMKIWLQKQEVLTFNLIYYAMVFAIICWP